MSLRLDSGGVLCRSWIFSVHSLPECPIPNERLFADRKDHSRDKFTGARRPSKARSNSKVTLWNSCCSLYQDTDKGAGRKHVDPFLCPSEQRPVACFHVYSHSSGTHLWIVDRNKCSSDQEKPQKEKAPPIDSKETFGPRSLKKWNWNRYRHFQNSLNYLN